MADYIGAAQIAQQGLRDLGKGVQDFGADRNRRKLGKKFQEINPDNPEAQFLGAGVATGDVTPGEAVKTVSSIDEVNPQLLLGNFMKKAMDPRLSQEQQTFYKKKSAEIIGIMELMSKAKGKSSGSDSGDPKNPFGSGLTRNKAIVSYLESIVGGLVEDGTLSEKEGKKMIFEGLMRGGSFDDKGDPVFGGGGEESFFNFMEKLKTIKTDKAKSENKNKTSKEKSVDLGF